MKRIVVLILVLITAAGAGMKQEKAKTKGPLTRTSALARDDKELVQPVVSPDPSDPKLAHLDGLNLSRAWMLEGIADALPSHDPRIPALLETATRHREASLPAVTGEYYEGGHWLGTFAVYLTSRAGLRNVNPGTHGSRGSNDN